MKRILKAIFIGILSVAMLACQGTTKGAKEVVATEENVEMIVVTTENEKAEQVEVEVPKNPKRIVTLDYLALDQISSWGLEGNVVGSVKSSAPSHLTSILDREEIVDLGTLKEIDMEALMSLNPDVIFISGRARAKFKKFSFIAPTIVSNLDYKLGSVESYKTLARRNATIFGMEEAVEKELTKTDERINMLREKAEGRSAIIGITMGGSLKTLGNKSRGSIIGRELGFENLTVKVDSTHGNSSSYELLLKANPEFIFILDKDTAVSREGASPAKQLMDNEIVHQTKAYKEGKIVYLTPDVWYLAEGGIESMNIMLDDIEEALKN